jgi:O-antigen/teichoic acid export membrane protein
MILSIKMVGVYKVYKEIAGILGRLSDPINQVIYPEFARLIGSDQINQSKNIAKKTIGLLFFVSLILTTLMLFSAKPVVNYFFGIEYMSHLSALYALIIFHWIIFFTTPINSLFIAGGFARYSFYLVLFSNTLFLLIAYFLGRLIGINGIIAAFIIQGLINQGLKILLMKRHPSGWNHIVR